MTTDGDTRTTARHDVAEGLADIARTLQGQDTPIETWRRIVDLAVTQLHGCQAAGISLVHSDGTIDTPVATEEVAVAVDRIQYATGQGPCLDAIRDHDVYRTGDLGSEAETRWPEFARRASDETGVCSMLAFRLFVQEDTLGALNLYSGDVDAFTAHDETIGALFAAHAALAMSSARDRQRGQDLESALASSRTIGLALGLLMEQRRVDRVDAFEILSGASQRANVKLRDLADQIVDGHEASLQEVRARRAGLA